MHEFGITSRIVAAVLRVATENGAGAVARVDLAIGKLTFLNHRQVRLAYDILVKGTILEGSRLEFEEIEGAVKCISCGCEKSASLPAAPWDHAAPLPLFSCPDCGGKVEIIRGKECAVTGIAFEQA